MKRRRVTRRAVVAGGLASTASPAAAGLIRLRGGEAPTGGGSPAQAITAVNLSNKTFVAQAGNAGTTIGQYSVMLSPGSPPAIGISWSLTGSDASLFTVDSGGNVKVGPSGVTTVRTYNVIGIATNAAYIGSPVAQTRAGTLKGIAPAVLSAITALTRPTGSIWAGPRNSSNEFPYAAFTTTVANPSAAINDYLDITAPSINGGAPVTNPWYLNDSSTPPGTVIKNATVHVPAVPGQYWNANFFSGTGYPVPTPSTTSWTLNLRHSGGSIIASVPVSVDMLKRNNPYFPWLSNYVVGAGVPNDMTPHIASGTTVAATTCGVVSGIVTFGMQLGGQSNFVPAVINSMIVQYQVDGVDVGPTVTGPPTITMMYDYTSAPLDSTQWADGTHALSVRCVDYTGGGTTPYSFRCYTQPFIVHNGGATLQSLYSGPQRIPIFDGSAGPNNRGNSSLPDFITFPGTSALPLHNTSVNIPTPQSGFIAPAYADSRYNTPSKAAALRDAANYYNENLPGAVMTEYTGAQRFFDNTLGGVFAYQSYPETPQGLEGAQSVQNTVQPFDGNRGDCLTTQISQGHEGYDAHGNPSFWLIAEATGRILRQNYDGSTQTLAGLTLNRSLLPYPTFDMPGAGTNISESQYTSRMIHVGTIGSPSFSDLRGCHDVKYDPRDTTYNTIFVANVLNQCVVRITGLLSGNPTMVRYAGQDKGLAGTTVPPNYFGDFQDGVATEFIAGSPVATFTGSISGGVLTISGTYTGSTNLKGCPISWDGPSTQNIVTGNMITTNISGSGSTWNTNVTGSVASVTMMASTQVALFNKPYSIEIADGTGADPAGTVYLADFQNHRLRKIDTSGNVTTLFGNQDNAQQGVGWTPITIGPFNINATLKWARGLLTVSTATAVRITQGQGQSGSFATPHDIAPYWTVQLNGTGNSNLDSRYFMVSPSGFVDNQHFKLVVANDPGMLGSTGTVTAYLQDAFVPTTPTYRPWNHGLATEAYFPWIQRLVFSSANPNAGTSISGGSTARHLVCSGPWHEAVMDVDLENQQVRTIGCLAGGPHNRGASPFGTGQSTIHETSASFFSCDCDAAGANGPLNDILLCQPSASLENWFWRLSWTGNEGAMTWAVQNSGQENPLRFGIKVGGGHYPWSTTFGRKQGRMLTNGTSDVGNFQWRIFNSAYDVAGGIPAASPHETPFVGTNYHYDIGSATRGMAIYCWGSISNWVYTSVPGMFPWNARPGMWCLHGAVQQQFLGLNTYSDGRAVGSNTDSFDALAANIPNDANLAAFIQSGFGGSVPRPELTGDDLNDLIYFIRRSSLTGCLVANPGAFPQRAAYMTDTTAPKISNASASRASTTSVTVTWDTTNKPTFGFAAAGFASAHGTSTPFHIFQLEATASGPASNSYKTTGHSVMITGLRPSVTTYVVIMAKDLAGNNAWSSVMTVT